MIGIVLFFIFGHLRSSDQEEEVRTDEWLRSSHVERDGGTLRHEDNSCNYINTEL